MYMVSFPGPAPPWVPSHLLQPLRAREVTTFLGVGLLFGRILTVKIGCGDV